MNRFSTLRIQRGGLDFLFSLPAGLSLPSSASASILNEFSGSPPGFPVDSIPVLIQADSRRQFADKCIYRDSVLQTWHRIGDRFRIRYSNPAEPASLRLDIEFTAAADRFEVTAGCLPTEENLAVAIAHLGMYPLDQVLTWTGLAGRRGAVHHAAGGIAAGRCWLFPGVSGAGKTTLSRLLQSRSQIELLSDDRMISRGRDGSFHGIGTPWPGDARIAVNKAAPLGGFLFLEQASENRAEIISPSAVFERLLPVTSIPWFDPGLFDPILRHLEELSRAVPGYRLKFRKDDGAADEVLRVALG